MSKPSLLETNRSYTFRSYFDLGFPVDELLAEFGYSLTRMSFELPQYQGELDQLNDLRKRIERTLPYTDLANEATRREVLIAPVVMDLVYYTRAQLRIEYNVTVSQQLQGTLDYYLKNQNRLLIIEAKQADMNRGFTQLATELIAIDQWADSKQPQLVGAVTTGNVWQFGVLERAESQVKQSLNLYRVPEDLEVLMRILVAVLELS